MRDNKGKSIIALPSEFIAIDTETTGLDYAYCNIIEVSAIKYANGQAIDRFSTLVKPPKINTYYPLRNDGAGEWVSYYVDDFISTLTGITNEMLENAPEPSAVFPLLLDFLGNSILIAHNASFDINFIYDAAEKHCSRALANDFIDTVRIARKVFPELEHHRLADVALACNIPQTAAHRAEDDSRVTAQCYLYMRNSILADSSEEDFRRLFTGKSNRYYKSLADVTATVDEIDDTNPIYGKRIVFTGTLSELSRKEAYQIVVNLGGIPEDTITKATNFLVIGNGEFAKSVKEGKTRKMLKAESFINRGCDISIISENAFFDLISG